MTINTELVRWANITEIDPLTGLSNKSVIPTEYKSSGTKANQPVPRQWINNQFNEIYNALVDTQAQLDAIVGGSSQPTLEAIYPVDSLYLSFNTTDPTTALGFGTWLAIEGKFLVGVDSGDVDFDTPRETGGVKSHTHTDNLTTDTDGAHTHTTDLQGDHTHIIAATGWDETPLNGPLPSPSTSGRLVVGSGQIESAEVLESLTHAAGTTSTGTDGDHTHTALTDGAHTHTMSGGVQSSSNVPPYIAVAMWRRIS